MRYFFCLSEVHFLLTLEKIISSSQGVVVKMESSMKHDMKSTVLGPVSTVNENQMVFSVR